MADIPMVFKRIAKKREKRNDTNELSHAPGLEGLVGGYPVYLNSKLCIPEGMTREKAIQIKEEAQKWDGIEKIKEDGTVVFSDIAIAYNTFKKLLDYNCKELKVDEIEKEPRS